MSNRGYYGAPYDGGDRGMHPRDRNPNYPAQAKPRGIGGLLGNPSQSYSALYRGQPGHLPGQYPPSAGYGVDPINIQQPQVIDYESRRINSKPVESRYGLGQGDYRATVPQPHDLNVVPSSLTPAAPVQSSFAGALSKISLDDLKNSLGGQLGNLLSKGLAQQARTDDLPSEMKNRYDLPDRQFSDRYAASGIEKGYSGDLSRDRDPRYSNDRLERGYGENGESARSYGDTGLDSRSLRRDDRYSNVSRSDDSGYKVSPSAVSPRNFTPDSSSLNSERRTLFPIASASEEKPRSILKKSILKKCEPAKDEPLIYIKPANDVVDEDDFLYGGGEESKASREPEVEQIPATKPDTQKIISNPAFTALLKQIGLDDLNMAERVKERQGEQQTAQNQQNLKARISSETEQGFGIDQTASFLSSGGVVLDNLLKLKQPATSQKDDLVKDNRQEKEDPKYSPSDIGKNLRRTDDTKRSDRDSRSTREDRPYDDRFDRTRDDVSDTKLDRRRNEKGSDRSSDRGFSKESGRRRSRSPVGRKRSPTGRRRSRSPGGRRRSRSPASKRRSRTPDKRARSRSPDKRGRDNSPSKKDHAKRQSGDGNSKRKDSLDTEKPLPVIKPTSRWSEVPTEGLPPPIGKSQTRAASPQAKPRASQSLEREREFELLSRKRMTENVRPDSPPSKFTKRDSEALQDLISKIPTDMKLTRAQFEELLAVHKAARAASPAPSSASSSRDSRSRRQRSQSPDDIKEKMLSAKDWVKSNSANASEEDYARGSFSSFRRRMGQDTAEDDFKNLKMVVRNDGTTPRASKITDDDLLSEKLPVKLGSPVPAIKREAEDAPDSSRRVVRRIGAMGSATLEKHAMDSDKEKYLKEFEQSEWQKAFGDEPLLPKLSRQEISNIRQIIEFNREKLAKAEKQLLILQESQSDAMKNFRHASVGEQYHLDKTIGQNIRLQNEITAEIKDLKKLVRDDELTLEEQFEQEKKIRDITRKKMLAAKAVEKNHGVKTKELKEDSPPPEKQDRKYRRAIEDKLMGKKSKEAGGAQSAAVPDAKSPGVSMAGTLHVEYYDPGTHWCKCCNFVAFKLYGYLEHLQTSSHMKRREKIGRPWQPDEVRNPPRKSLISRQETAVQPMKGVEFIHPVDSYYCKICNYFTGDKESVEFHLKSAEHHKQYEIHITDNPMYEKRFKMDKDAGLVEAKRLEVKRKEEQERQREAQREEEERQRELERRREREKREEEEKRKQEKLQKLQAKKKAEVLAITRGDSSDSDVEMLPDEPTEKVPVKLETPQEKIKRELLEKMRAKKAGITEEPGVINMENVLSKASRLAKEAKKAQDKVKAKAAEIEQSVYGPKLSAEGPEGPPGLFLTPETKAKTTEAAKTKKSQAGVIPMPSTVSFSNLPTHPPKILTSAATTTSSPQPNVISPFVQKMMQMEKSGEIITTASVKANTVRPQMMQQPMQQQPMGNYGPNFGQGQMGPGGPMMNQMGPMGPPGNWGNNQMMGQQMNNMSMGQGPMMGPPGQIMGPPGQMMGPPGQMMGPTNQMMGPQQIMGPPGQMMGPPGQMMGPPGQMMGPSNQMMGPPGQGMGPSGPMMRSPVRMMGPPGQGMGPPNQIMGPPGPMMATQSPMMTQNTMGAPNAWIPDIQTNNRRVNQTTSIRTTTNISASSVLSDVSPPGTTPVPIPPSETTPGENMPGADSSSSSSSSSDSDDDSETNNNGAGHSFSLSGLLLQFSADNGIKRSTPALAVSSTTKLPPKSATTTKLAATSTSGQQEYSSSASAASSVSVTRSSDIATVTSPATSVQSESPNKSVPSASQGEPASHVQLADSTVQGTEVTSPSGTALPDSKELTVSDSVVSTAVDEALTEAESEELTAADAESAENIDDMTFTVIDSVGEDDDKS